MKVGSVAVALLFDDVDLGRHLRTALSEHGARIAHEGPVSSFDVVKLRQAGVNVLVVNLDDSVDDTALDLIYELVAAGDIPVVPCSLLSAMSRVHRSRCASNCAQLSNWRPAIALRLT